ncbi:hypothetical protein P3X46_029118 [Hevea brasiliensis]|uniref:F-box domain-containing protein n=1 Tax=Hevea brasiliensis TaxID=3981 RepID=A0ABQ9KR77_HEVBR|nr:putative F-box protein At1g65770 [Hevea brasiliensis]KAJ9146903.1 hypothetical protein P3X46_029118 [Hevea brasiliensis]
MSEWSDLPKELLQTIAKCLDSRVDVLRLRSVCTSWRSSVSFPSFDEEIPPLILKLPQPIGIDAVLFHATICRMEFSHQNANSSSSESNSKGWLTKIRVSKLGKLKLVHPLSDYPIMYSPFTLNLLDFRFFELSKAFMLKFPFGFPLYEVNKVVLFPISARCSKYEISILAIYHEGKLGYWKYGDESWTLLDDKNFQYDDIIEYKGQFYVVDRWGTVSWIDSSLKLIQYSPPLFGCGGQKNLVESCGDLYVVDRYLDGERRTWNDYENLDVNFPARRRTYRMCNPNATDFRIHKLDEEWGTWVDVKSLGDRAFVLGVDCSFSISSGDFFGGKGNCIYFTDDDNFKGKGLSSDSIRVFRLENHIIEKVTTLPEYSQIFWPPNFGLTGSNSAPKFNVTC